MYPRMKLLVQFLRPDGFLLVSLNEAEVARFRLMMEEILPTTNYIATLNWKSRRNLDNRSLHNVSVDHEYVIAYRLGDVRFRGTVKDMTKYSNPDNDPRGPWMSDNLVGLATKDRRPNLHYDLVDPETGNVYPPTEKGWRYSKETMRQKIKEGRILWPSKKSGRPRHKKFVADLQNEYAGFSSFIQCGNTNEGTEEVSQIMGGEQFIFPKPRSLIQTLLQQTTSGNDIVLDSFAGTGTTAHAVMALNAEDGGNRRFILVEMDTQIARTITSERVKRVIAGYKFTGTEKKKLYEKKLTWTTLKKAERVVSKIEQFQENNSDLFVRFEKRIEDSAIVLYGRRKIEGFKEGLGGGFRYCELGETLFAANGQLRHKEVTFTDLARHVFFTETGSPLPANRPDGSPLIGIFNHTAIYLLYNGIIADVQPDGGNVLTRSLLASLPPHAGPKIIYGNGCLVSPAYLQRHNITFRQTPYEVKVA
jgi:adenine-specific DNA-methyltransferase